MHPESVRLWFYKTTITLTSLWVWGGTLAGLNFSVICLALSGISRILTGNDNVLRGASRVLISTGSNTINGRLALGLLLAQPFVSTLCALYVLPNIRVS